jgi:hypothetical protein
MERPGEIRAFSFQCARCIQHIEFNQKLHSIKTVITSDASVDFPAFRLLATLTFPDNPTMTSAAGGGGPAAWTSTVQDLRFPPFRR